MNIWKDFFNVFFPDCCCCCNKVLTYNEHTCCLNCIHDLPLTYFSSEKNNPIESAFYGRIPLVAGTSLLFFQKNGIVQQLIYNLKYRGQQQVGTFTGNWLGEEMILSNRFEDIQAIVPVPLHKNKLRKRGYNQVSVFGQTLSRKLNIPFFEHALLRINSYASQTKKMRFDRWKNVAEIFVLNHTVELSFSHVLLIDDVITTGATLEACYNALKTIPGLKISIACIAYTE